MTTIHTRQLQQYTQDNYNNTHKTTTTIHTRQLTTTYARKLQQYTQDNYKNTHRKTKQYTQDNYNNSKCGNKIFKMCPLLPCKHCLSHILYRCADKSLARPGRKQAYVSVRMAWISFGALLCRKKKLMKARVSMLLKSRVFLACFRARFLPGRPKDLSAPRHCSLIIKSTSCSYRSTEGSHGGIRRILSLLLQSTGCDVAC